MQRQRAFAALVNAGDFFLPCKTLKFSANGMQSARCSQPDVSSKNATETALLSTGLSAAGSMTRPGHQPWPCAGRCPGLPSEHAPSTHKPPCSTARAP